MKALAGASARGEEGKNRDSRSHWRIWHDVAVVQTAVGRCGAAFSSLISSCLTRLRLTPS